jgi:hypothetical protein
VSDTEPDTENTSKIEEAMYEELQAAEFAELKKESSYNFECLAK